ncbi:hypothetical protein ABZS76_33285 [Streptomyces sp. NPDC005562]|uniref:hypothetical protein n=1 Tax=Streptomyces sp. NPDC005562 TaxID=3154890 RepID=UPI0033B70E6B
MRAHFNRPLTDQAGNQINEAQVRLLVQGTIELLQDTIYAEAASGLTRTNPWNIANGEIDFFLDSPTRLQIGIKVGAAPEELWDNVDVLAVATDSSHPGAGADSTQVGLAAAAQGAGATSLGKGASALGDQSTAVGLNASAAVDGAVAIGSQASASQAGAVAVGQSALAHGTQATALGDSARAVFDQSTAVGAGAQVTRPSQVVLGTAADLVDIPGTGVLHSPNGTAFMLTVTDEGVLYTQKLPPYVAPPPPEEGEGGDGGGI